MICGKQISTYLEQTTEQDVGDTDWIKTGETTLTFKPNKYPVLARGGVPAVFGIPLSFYPELNNRVLIGNANNYLEAEELVDPRYIIHTNTVQHPYGQGGTVGPNSDEIYGKCKQIVINDAETLIRSKPGDGTNGFGVIEIHNKASGWWVLVETLSYQHGSTGKIVGEYITLSDDRMRLLVSVRSADTGTMLAMDVYTTVRADITGWTVGTPAPVDSAATEISVAGSLEAIDYLTDTGIYTTTSKGTVEVTTYPAVNPFTNIASSANGTVLIYAQNSYYTAFTRVTPFNEYSSDYTVHIPRTGDRGTCGISSDGCLLITPDDIATLHLRVFYRASILSPFQELDSIDIADDFSYTFSDMTIHIQDGPVATGNGLSYAVSVSWSAIKPTYDMQTFFYTFTLEISDMYVATLGKVSISPTDTPDQGGFYEANIDRGLKHMLATYRVGTTITLGEYDHDDTNGWVLRGPLPTELQSQVGIKGLTGDGLIAFFLNFANQPPVINVMERDRVTDPWVTVTATLTPYYPSSYNNEFARYTAVNATGTFIASTDYEDPDDLITIHEKSTLGVWDIKYVINIPPYVVGTKPHHLACDAAGDVLVVALFNQGTYYIENILTFVIKRDTGVPVVELVDNIKIPYAVFNNTLSITLSGDGLTMFIGCPYVNATIGGIMVYARLTIDGAWGYKYHISYPSQADSMFGYDVQANYDGSSLVVTAPSADDPITGTTGIGVIYEYNVSKILVPGLNRALVAGDKILTGNVDLLTHTAMTAGGIDTGVIEEIVILAVDYTDLSEVIISTPNTVNDGDTVVIDGRTYTAVVAKTITDYVKFFTIAADNTLGNIERCYKITAPITTLATEVSRSYDDTTNTITKVVSGKTDTFRAVTRELIGGTLGSTVMEPLQTDLYKLG